MSTLIEQLKHYFDNTPRDIIEKEWEDLGLLYEDVSPTVEEFLISLKKEKDTDWKYVLNDTEIMNTQKNPSNNSDFFVYFVYLRINYQIKLWIKPHFH